MAKKSGPLNYWMKYKNGMILVLKPRIGGANTPGMRIGSVREGRQTKRWEKKLKTWNDKKPPSQKKKRKRKQYKWMGWPEVQGKGLKLVQLILTEIARFHSLFWKKEFFLSGKEIKSCDFNGKKLEKKRTKQMKVRFELQGKMCHSVCLVLWHLLPAASDSPFYRWIYFRFPLLSHMVNL